MADSLAIREARAMMRPDFWIAEVWKDMDCIEIVLGEGEARLN